MSRSTRTATADFKALCARLGEDRAGLRIAVFDLLELESAAPYLPLTGRKQLRAEALPDGAAATQVTFQRYGGAALPMPCRAALHAIVTELLSKLDLQVEFGHLALQLP